MAVKLQSQFAKRWQESCLRRCRQPTFRTAWLATLWIWLPVCYVGILISPAVGCGIVLQALHALRTIFWAAGILSLAFLAWSVFRLARLSVQYLRARIICADSIVALTGFLLGWLFVAYTLATGFYFHP